MEHIQEAFYKKISLSELGVDQKTFLNHVKPIYEELEWDCYDTVRGGLDMPTRKRALAEFELNHNGQKWVIDRVKAQGYAQGSDHGDYNRTEPRIYPEVPIEITDHEEVKKFQAAVADIAKSVRKEITKIRMIFTFLRTVDEEGRTGICALEGEPHIDDMDFIVSALVIHRENLQADSGESSVYDLKKNRLLETVLQPGEGIFQDDKNLMHHITDIKRAIKNRPGIRDMLGVDIEIIN